MQMSDQRNSTFPRRTLFLLVILFAEGRAAPRTANTTLAPSMQPDHLEVTQISNYGYKYNSTDTATVSNNTVMWMPRSGWQAAAPLHRPAPIAAAGDGSSGVSHVIIHHTATTADPCRRSSHACAAIVRAIQRTHQQQRGWDDIGYNFLIGGSDERAEIYEGRGFNVVGAHTVGYNARSVGIALIGDWTAVLPPRPVLDKLKQLISYGIEMGHIQRDYTMLGHRQVKATLCPGDRLYNELKQWPHFVQNSE